MNNKSIDIYSEITESDLQRVTDLISKSKKGEPLDIHVSSGGGDIISSYAMVNRIKDYFGRVRIFVDSLAASAATIFLTLGTVYSWPTSLFMLHQARTGVYGRVSDLQSTSKVLETINKSIAALYSQKTNKPIDYFTNILESGNDYWLDANEAKQLGLVDKILEGSVINNALSESFKFKNADYSQIPLVKKMLYQNKISRLENKFNRYISKGV